MEGLVVDAPLFGVPKIAKQADGRWVDATVWACVYTEIFETFEMPNEPAMELEQHEERDDAAQSYPREHPLCVARQCPVLQLGIQVLSSCDGRFRTFPFAIDIEDMIDPFVAFEGWKTPEIDSNPAGGKQAPLCLKIPKQRRGRL